MELVQAAVCDELLPTAWPLAIAVLAVAAAEASASVLITTIGQVYELAVRGLLEAPRGVSGATTAVYVDENYGRLEVAGRASW